MSALASLLSSFRQAAMTEREKGTYFEDLVLAYLKTEPRSSKACPSWTSKRQQRFSICVHQC